MMDMLNRQNQHTKKRETKNKEIFSGFFPVSVNCLKTKQKAIKQ